MKPEYQSAPESGYRPGTITRNFPLTFRLSILFLLTMASVLKAFAAHWEHPLALQDFGETGANPVVTKPAPTWPGTREYYQVKINTDDSGWLQNEEQCAINPLNTDQRFAAWRDFRLGYRQLGLGWSDDGGTTWQDRLLAPDETIYDWQSDPGVTWDSNGNLYLISLDFIPDGRNALVIYISEDFGQTFELMGWPTDQDADTFEDKELMNCDRSGSEWDGALDVVWTRFDYESGTQTHIYHSRSLDQGATWSEPQEISDYGVQWPWSVCGANGEIYIGWCSWNHGGIRFSRSLDGGVTFSDPETIRPNTVFSVNLNGDVTTFAYPAMDVDLSEGEHHGRLHLLHMDMTYGDADVWYLNSDDGGQMWSTPVRLNTDEIGNGLDQFHPWIVVDELGQVYAIWYDRRNDENNYLIDLYYRMSPDGGETWNDEIRITSHGFDPQAGSLNRGGLLGEYLGLAARQGQVQLVFTDTRDGDQDAWGCAFTALQDTFCLVEPLDYTLPGFVENVEFRWTSFPEASGYIWQLFGVDEDSLVELQQTFVTDTTHTMLLDWGEIQYDEMAWTVTAFAGTDVYAAGASDNCPGMGAIRFPDHVSAVIPERIELTASPNPFNPRTTLSWTQDHPGRARIELFNTVGERVRLLERDIGHSGLQRQILDGYELPSGIYIVRLTSGNTQGMTRVLLLR